MEEERKIPLQKEIRIPAAGFGALTVLLVSAAALSPVTFASWFGEDRWGEWATFYAFAALAVAASAALARSFKSASGEEAAAPAWLRRGWFFALAASGALVALEEISWGQRLIGFLPSESFLKSYGRDFGVHGVLQSRRFNTKWLVAGVSLAYGIVLPLLAAVVSGRSGRPARSAALPVPPRAQIPWHAAIVAAAVTHPVNYTGEAIELMLGVLLATDALRRFPLKEGASVSSSRAAALGLALPLLLGVVTPPLLEATLYRPTPEQLALAGNELQALKEDLTRPGALNDARFAAKVGAHARIENAVQRGFIVPGEESAFKALAEGNAVSGGLAGNPRRYDHYIDPWGNSYWFLYRRGTDGILLYSMGPNRRRDTDFKKLDQEKVRDTALSGDDLGVWFEWKPQASGAPKAPGEGKMDALRKRLPEILRMLQRKKAKEAEADSAPAEGAPSEE